MPVKFKCILEDGRVVTGPIQGNGGYLGSYRGGVVCTMAMEEQRKHAHMLILEAIRIFEKFGRQRVVFEPAPGCCAVYPNDCAESRGEPVAAPLIGTKFEIVR